MNEISVKELTPEQLGAEVRLLTRQARTMVLGYGVEIGRRLAAAKEKCGHGEWGRWLERETELSQSSANRFMRLFEEYGAAQGSLFGAEVNSSTLTNLSISNALRLLAVPEEERESFAAEVDAEHLSARELEEAIRERDAARRALEEAEEGYALTLGEAKAETEAAREREAESAERAREYREALRKREQELEEARNSLVTVQTDEEAVERARAEEREAAERTLEEKREKWQERLREEETARTESERERDKLREALKSAEAAAEGAQRGGDAAVLEARAAAESARQEAERLQKRLEAAESGAEALNVYFRQWQESFAGITERIGKMQETHPETAEKLLGGARRLAEQQKRTLEDMET